MNATFGAEQCYFGSEIYLMKNSSTKENHYYTSVVLASRNHLSDDCPTHYLSVCSCIQYQTGYYNINNKLGTSKFVHK